MSSSFLYENMSISYEKSVVHYLRHRKIYPDNRTFDILDNTIINNNNDATNVFCHPEKNFEK